MKRLIAKRRHQMAEQAGAVLVIALAFLMVAGVSVAAILTNTDVALKHTTVARTKQDLNYAADAGLEWGIQHRRNLPSVCQNASTVYETVGTVQVGDASVTVRCKARSGYTDPNALVRRAVVTTEAGPAKSLITSGGGTPIIKGDVFANGTVDIKNLEVQGGDFRQRTTACIAPGGLTVSPTPPYSWQCTNDAVPNFFVKLPDSPPSYMGSSSTAAGCTIFYPGKYTAANPMVLSGGTSKFYLASGVYYFENTGVISMGNNTTMLGGSAPATEQPSLLPSYGCDDNTARTAKPTGNNISGGGVELIFGGNAGLEVGNQTTVELNSRSIGTGDPSGTAGINVYGVEQTPSKPGWLASSTTTNVLKVSSNSNTAQFTAHGVIYSPNSPIELSATNNTVASAQRGLVARSLTMQSSNSIGDGFSITNVGGDPVYSTPTIEFVATATRNGTTGTAEAVVDVYNDSGPPAYTSIVKSWRTVGVP